jgi:hypothetical protein
MGVFFLILQVRSYEVFCTFAKKMVSGYWLMIIDLSKL